MRRWLSFLLFVVAGTALAQSRPSSMTPDALREFFDSAIPDQLRSKRIPGAVVIVVKDGAVLFSEGRRGARGGRQTDLNEEPQQQGGSVAEART